MDLEEYFWQLKKLSQKVKELENISSEIKEKNYYLEKYLEELMSENHLITTHKNFEPDDLISVEKLKVFLSNQIKELNLKLKEKEELEEKLSKIKSFPDA